MYYFLFSKVPATILYDLILIHCENTSYKLFTIIDWKLKDCNLIEINKD